MAKKRATEESGVEVESGVRTSLDLPAPIVKALDEMAKRRYEARAVIVRELIVKGLRQAGMLE